MTRRRTQEELRAWAEAVNAAFAELTDGWSGWRSRNQMGELMKHRQPLVAVRCRADGTLAAGAWQTAHGPLLVTAGRVDRRAGALWEPRQALLDHPEPVSAEVLPPWCPDCGRMLDLDWMTARAETNAARRSRVRTLKR